MKGGKYAKVDMISLLARMERVEGEYVVCEGSGLG